jgi:hypothetical protein
MRVAERVITQEEHYKIVERLCSSAEVKTSGNGWRRPTLLAKLRQTFLAA